MPSVVWISRERTTQGETACVIFQLNREKYEQLILPPLGPEHFGISPLVLCCRPFILNYLILRTWKISRRLVIIRDKCSLAQRRRVSDLPKMTQFLSPSVRLWHPWRSPLWRLLGLVTDGAVRTSWNELNWISLMYNEFLSWRIAAKWKSHEKPYLTQKTQFCVRNEDLDASPSGRNLNTKCI